MNKRFKFLVENYDSLDDEQCKEFNSFVFKGVDNDRIPKSTISNIAYFLRSYHKEGICMYHGTIDTDDDYYYLAYQAAICKSGDIWRIDCEGGYPSEFQIIGNKIYIATISNDRPELIICDSDEAIRDMLDCDEIWCK